MSLECSIQLLRSFSHCLLGHLSAHLGFPARHPSLLQLSLGSSSNAGLLLLHRCSSLVLGASCSSTASAAGTLAGGSSDAPAQGDAAPNPSPAASAAAGPLGGAANAWMPSSFISSSKCPATMLLAVSAVSSTWPVQAVHVRHVHSTRCPPPGRWAVVSPRQLTSMLKHSATPQQLLQLLQQHKLEQQGGMLNAIHVAACYHRLGAMCRAEAALARTAAAQQLLQHLDQLLLSVRQQLNARALANIIWSCAYTQHAAAVVQLLPDFLQPGTLSAANSQEVANVLWALASLEQQVPLQQLQQLVDAFLSLAGPAGPAVPQEISNAVWALGKLGYQLPQQQLRVLLAAFTAEGMLGRASAQVISSLLLGIAYMGQQLPKAQLHLLLAELSAKAENAKPQAISNSLWAVSEMGQAVPNDQLEQLLAAFEQQLHRAMSQEVSNTLLACARFRYFPDQLLTALEKQQHMQQFLAGANLQELANTAWAYGILGRSSTLLVGGLLQQAKVLLLQQDSSRHLSQELSNLCWAVAVLDLREHVPAVLQLVQASSSLQASVVPKALQQLYQVHLWLLDTNLPAANGAKGPGLLQVLSKQQLEEYRKAWQDQVAAGARKAAAASSPMRQLVFVLQQLPGWQVPPQQEVITEDRNFSIDITAVTAAGARVAVELDGYSHFLSPGNRVDGPTQYRNRALAARGYTVVTIPGWQWRQLKGVQQQQEYLQDKLKAAGAPPST